jgi:acyl-coenzyme A thioesterase PaaI-like protein
MTSEIASTRWQRWWLQFRFNLFPCYRRTGARIDYVGPGGREVRVKLPLNWKTRGYWGTTFGGSMYGAVDPVLLVMLSRRLGPAYMVWDKAAKIEFKRPGRSTLYASFLLEDSDIADIKERLEQTRRIDRTYNVELRDAGGMVCAAIEKVVTIRRRDPGEGRPRDPSS